VSSLRFGIWRLLIAATLVNVITFGVTAPPPRSFRSPTGSSTVSRLQGPTSFVGVPLISVCRLAFTAFAGYLAWRYLQFQPLTETHSSGGSLLTLAILYGVPAAALLVFRWYREGHEGADIDVYFRDVGRRAEADV